MRYFWILAVVGAAGLLSGCVDRQAQGQAKRTQALINDPVQLVSVQPAERQTVEDRIEITGAFVTAEDSQVGAKVGARLVAMFVKEGDPVRAGQVIAQQETTDALTRVRQAQAGVDAARSQVDQAMQDARVGPQRTSAAVAGAEARVRQAEANLAKARAGARTEERRQAEAAVNAAKSSLELARRELDRGRRLVREGAIAQAEVDRLENAYNAALAQYEQALENQRLLQSGTRVEDIAAAEQEVRAAREALRSERASKQLDSQFQDRVNAARANYRSAVEQLNLARQELSNLTIRSPFSGRVAGRPSQPGTFLGPGSPVARIVAVEGTYFEGQVPESAIDVVDVGQTIRVEVDATGRTYTGRVSAINPVGSAVGRLFAVRVVLAGGSEGVKPGMFARGIVTIDSVPNATVVPVTSVVRRGDRQGVFVVESQKARFKPVRLGIRSGDRVAVEGIAPGETVVIEGQTAIEDGNSVRIETRGETAQAAAPRAGG